MTTSSHPLPSAGPMPTSGTSSATRSGARLGVDLGTTWTAASLNGEALPLADRRTAMPSVVALDGERFVTGDAAERRLLVDPASGAREMKRRLGDTTPYVLNGTPFGPEALMARLLADVVAVATERSGSAIDEVTITHPANWGEYKLDLLRECARLAGVSSPRLLSEPQAAALHYVAMGRLQPGQTVAVYDFGGGTFDAAVVRCTDVGAELVGTAEGLERLGGIDIDQIVVAHVNEVLDQQLGELDTDNPEVRRGLTRLRADCTSAKEALSTDSEVSITVAVPGLSTVVRLTRSEFEEALRPRLADTLAALDRTLHSAGVRAADLAGVVLVGGSSRIPLVRETVAEHTGRPVLVDADPKLVVCMGATDRVNVSAADEAGGAAAIGAASDGTKPTASAAADASAVTGPGARIVASTDGATTKRAAGQRVSGGVAAVAGVAAVGAVAAGAYAVNEYVLNDGDESLDAFDGGFLGEALADGLGGFSESAGSPDDGAVGALGGIDPQALAAAGGPSAAELSLLAALLDPPQDVAGMPAPAGPGSGGGFSNGGGGGGGYRPPPPHPTPGRPAQQHEPAADPAPSSGGMSRPQTQPPLPPSPPSGTPDPLPSNAELEQAKQTLLERLEKWEPPAGADAAEVAELRERLGGLIDRHQAIPGQSTEEAIEALREQFSLRVHDFTQDVKLDTLIEESERGAAAAEEAAATPDPRVTMPPMPSGTPIDDDPPMSDAGMEEGDIDGPPAAEPMNTGVVPPHLSGGASVEAHPDVDAPQENGPAPAMQPLVGAATGDAGPTKWVDEFDELVGSDAVDSGASVPDAERPVAPSPTGDVAATIANPIGEVHMNPPQDGSALSANDVLGDDVLGSDAWRAEAALDEPYEAAPSMGGDGVMSSMPVGAIGTVDESTASAEDTDSEDATFHTAVEPFDEPHMSAAVMPDATSMDADEFDIDSVGP